MQWTSSKQSSLNLRKLLFSILGVVITSSESYACDLTVQEDVLDEIRYRDRGHYCEGSYRRPYSGQIEERFKIIGLQPALGVVDDEVVSTAVVRAASLLERPLHLVIVGMVPAKFYRLDAHLEAGTSELNWSLEIVRHVRINLGSRDLAAIACIDSCSDRKRILVPFVILTKSSAGNKQELLFSLPIEAQSFSLSVIDKLTGKELRSAKVSRPSFNPSKIQRVAINEIFSHRMISVNIRAVLRDGSALVRNVQIRGMQE